MGLVRGIVVELACAIHFRLTLYLSRFPFQLIDIVRPGVSDEQRRVAAELLFKTAECCLDPWLSLKLRNQFATSDALLDSESAMDLLRAWMNRGHLTVAHVERAHAKNTASFAALRKVRRHVEGAIYHSYLKDHMSWHVKRGRANNSLQRNAAKYASSKFGLVMDRNLKRRTVRRAGCGWARTTKRSFFKGRGRTLGNMAWRYVSYRFDASSRQSQTKAMLHPLEPQGKGPTRQTFLPPTRDHPGWTPVGGRNACLVEPPPWDSIWTTPETFVGCI